MAVKKKTKEQLKLEALEEAFVRLTRHLIRRRMFPFDELREVLKPLGIHPKNPSNPGVFLYDGSEKEVK